MTIDLSGLITAADKFAQAKQTKIAALSAACKQSIIDGFNSDALGTTHHYPAKDTDQTNLHFKTILSKWNSSRSKYTTPLWCADKDNKWEMIPHTPQQVLAVAVQQATDIETKTKRNAELAVQVVEATDPEALDAIKW